MFETLFGLIRDVTFTGLAISPLLKWDQKETLILKPTELEVVFHPFCNGVSSVLSNHTLTWVVAKGPVQVFQSLKTHGFQ